MKIPEEYCTTDYWRLLYRRAYRVLTMGAVLPPNYTFVRFPSERSGEDLDQLAKDLVQQTYVRVCTMDEKEEIGNWHPFLRRQLDYQILTACTRARRRPAMIAVCVSDVDNNDPTEVHEICLADKNSLTPAELVLLDELINVCREELENGIARGKIKGSGQIAPFLEVVRRYLEQPRFRFDTHRQAIQEIDPNTPSKATANRWWHLIRQPLAKALLGRKK
jgi:hypothetical protein